MEATGDVPDVDVPPPLAPLAPLADAGVGGVGEAHYQEGGEEEEPANDECIDLEDEEFHGFSPASKAFLSAACESTKEEPRPDNTFGSPFALQ